MNSNGKQLEGLVAFVEKTLLPQGFDVKTNERVYNEEGIQIAEFDIEVRGKVGSTNIAWLIECRDRPGQGPAPGSWIEQLLGRRIRFGFNKITAVSTTGFAPGAVQFAKEQGIELREVKALKPEEFARWLAIQNITAVQHMTILENATILVNKDENDDRRKALSEVLTSLSGGANFLKSSKTGDLVSAATAFMGAVASVGNLFDDLTLNSPAKHIKLQAQYPADDDHFIVDTTLGPVRVESILFKGKLAVSEQKMPLALTAEYRHAETGKMISQVASFEPQSVHGMMLSFEMHHVADTGQTHIVLRRVADNTSKSQSVEKDP